MTEVERHLLAMDERFGLEAVGLDPWQAEHIAQRLEADSGRRRRNALRVFGALPWMRETPPTASNLRERATRVIESLQDHRLQLYDYAPLRRDLTKLRVEEKSYGARLTSPRDGDGHGDTASGFALALLLAHEFVGNKPVTAGVLTADGTGDEYLTPLERAVRRAAGECDRFDRAMELAREPADEDEELRALFRLAGRG